MKDLGATLQDGQRATGPFVELGGRRVLRPGRWLWARTLGWLVLLFFLTAAAFGLPLQWAVDHVPADDPAAQFAGVAGACVAAVAVYAVAVRFGEGRQPRELALRPALPALAAGTVLGALLMGLLMGLLAVTNLYEIDVVGTAPAWAGLGLALQAAVTEELWTRALLLRLVWRIAGPVPAFAVVAVVFGALHLSNPGATPLAAATVAMAGLMFSALYALTGRLWVPIGLHFAWNLTQGYVFGADVSGSGFGHSIAVSTPNAARAQWLTGGAFGPEASAFAFTIVTIVTVGALLVSRTTRRADRVSGDERGRGRTSGDAGGVIRRSWGPRGGLGARRAWRRPTHRRSGRPGMLGRVRPPPWRCVRAARRPQSADAPARRLW